jgi:hypothetical protein
MDNRSLTNGSKRADAAGKTSRAGSRVATTCESPCNVFKNRQILAAWHYLASWPLTGRVNPILAIWALA